jgi:hypothetical protein
MNESRISLVWEYNAYLEEPKATIWVVKGDCDPSSDLSENPNARRLIGPIEFDLCGNLHQSLAEVLRWLGHDVIVHDVADD